jgi:hypothetical protein
MNEIATTYLRRINIYISIVNIYFSGMNIHVSGVNIMKDRPAVVDSL